MVSLETYQAQVFALETAQALQLRGEQLKTNTVKIHIFHHMKQFGPAIQVGYWKITRKCCTGCPKQTARFELA